MGRDLFWYTIPDTLEHTRDEEIVCLSLESNGYDVVSRDICESFPQDEFGDYEVEKCCAKCLLFLGDLRLSPLVTAFTHVGYSYSNPLWTSKWNIYNILSKSKTEFTQQFKANPLLFEITLDDLVNTETKLKAMGEPSGPGEAGRYDTEAYEESMRVLAFIRSSLDQAGVRVLYKGEE